MFYGVLKTVFKILKGLSDTNSNPTPSMKVMWWGEKKKRGNHHKKGLIGLSELKLLWEIAKGQHNIFRWHSKSNGIWILHGLKEDQYN